MLILSLAHFVVFICRIKELAIQRRTRLNEANKMHQFLRDIDDEEAWIKYESCMKDKSLNDIIVLVTAYWHYQNYKNQYILFTFPYL